MATILTVGSSDGHRRCSALCYNAKGTACRCVCGGKNHGKGYERAVREQHDELLPLLREQGLLFEAMPLQLGLPHKETT
jgi:hypothetical protein